MAKKQLKEGVQLGIILCMQLLALSSLVIWTNYLSFLVVYTPWPVEHNMASVITFWLCSYYQYECASQYEETDAALSHLDFQ